MNAEDRKCQKHLLEKNYTGFDSHLEIETSV